MDDATPDARYEREAVRHAQARDEARRRSLALGTVRVVTFLAAGGAGVAWDVLGPPAEAWALAAALVLVALFVVEVVLHRRARERERWHATLADIAEQGSLRLARAWGELDAALPPVEREQATVDPTHPFARDLDVVGRASLVRLLGPVTSEGGRAVLMRWLMAGPVDAPGALARQGAARELAGDLETRMAFTAHGRILAPDRVGGLHETLEWAEAEPWLSASSPLRLIAWLSPAVLVVAALGSLLAGWPPWWLIPALLQAEVFRRTATRADADLHHAAAGGDAVRAYVPQMLLLEGSNASQPRREALKYAGARPQRVSATDSLLAELEGRLAGNDGAAHAAVGRLSRLIDTIDSRHNMFWASLAPVLLLDLHLTMALDRWRRRHRGRVRGWVDALGEWEALSALASLRFDHPEWSFPTFTKGATQTAARTAPVLRASRLGHPLLPRDACVRNDVEVGPPGTFLLVTGSNMSGKSTLLRALGANAILAGAGAPVCAEALELPPLRVHTSMRIDDSLAEGVSLFMAELLRVRGIVEAAEPAEPAESASSAGSAGSAESAGSEGHVSGGSRPAVLYLLDEILHGTNSAERRVAARGVIRHMLAADAIGAVSTHDLTLADAPDLAERAEPVHFREQVVRSAAGTRLDFDYTLRPGLATTRNALKLLEAVGLGGLELEEE